MRYTVTWATWTQSALAKIWMADADQQGIADASDGIDRNLKNDPDRKGVPYGEFYIYEVAPLRVYFKLSPDDRLVRVVYVQRI